MIVENAIGVELAVERIEQQQRNDVVAGYCINFAVSMNEEHVTLRISDGRKLIDLGERTHHYTLLALARQRLCDAERGFDESCQGWVETERLAHSLGIDAPHLNIHIFRARNQFKQAFSDKDGMIGIIERRRNELRFGLFRFRIIRGANLEGSFHPVSSPLPDAYHLFR